jgi:isoquinoline 1-oxidoreductase beta subunit
VSAAITRRAFVQVMAAAGGGLALGVRTAGARGAAAPGFHPSVWLGIDRQGTIVARVGKSEMGQGVRTSLPMILAEELDADLASVTIEQASPGPGFDALGTGGSGSLMRSWDALRQAGAAARQMLVAAAAQRLGVAAGALETDAGFVRHPPSGRRLSYGELAADAARQPVPERPALKPRASFRLIGRPVKRLDGPDLVTGRARFGLDVRPRGLLRALVARPPRLGAKLVSFDAAAAKRVRGVRRVIEIPSGVAVVADDTWAALKGREALRLVWSDSPHASFDSDEHLRGLEEAVARPGITIRKDGAGRAALAGAARRLEAVYLYPFGAHASVEPVSCTALVERRRCTIWSPSQTPNAVQRLATELLGLPASAVKVHVTLLGGGFGRRLGVDFDREALEVARRVAGTPVQLVWSREDDMRHGYFQAASAHRLAAGIDAAGRVVAWEHRKASTPHNARRVPTDEEKRSPDSVRGWAWGVYDSPYHVPAAEMSYAVVDAPVPIGPWRSVFSPSSVFAREGFVDEIAVATGKDPLRLRLELLGAGDPSVPAIYTIDGEKIDRARLRRVLETVAEKAGWGTPPRPGTARGLACNVFHTETYIAYVVEVALRRGAGAADLPFSVERVVCAMDCGLVVNPAGVAQQVESGVLWSLSNMKSAITVRSGAIVEGTYQEFPVAMIHETPAVIETHLVDSGDERPHGIGEPVVCPLAPAVASALSRLTGKRVRRLPVRAADLA